MYKVKVTKCSAKLQFVKALKEVLNLGLKEAKDLTDSLIESVFVDGEWKQQSVGTLIVLNDSFTANNLETLDDGSFAISSKSWKEIVSRMIPFQFKWEYV